MQKLSGASKLYIEDIVDDFAENYIMPCVQASAVYENKYLSRYFHGSSGYCKDAWLRLQEKKALSAICHGATGKGNDQIRFELAYQSSGSRHQDHRSMAYD